MEEVQLAKYLKNIFSVSFLSKIFVDKVHGAVAGGEAWGEADIGPALQPAATFARLHLASLASLPHLCPTSPLPQRLTALQKEA